MRGRWRSAKAAWNGLALLWLETNFRIELAGAALAVAISLVLGRGLVAIALACGLVLSLEAVNTAAERLVDLASPGWSAAAGRVKDLTAGAVLIAACAALAVGLISWL